MALPRTPLGWFFRLWRQHPSLFVPSPRADAHPRPWPGALGFDPGKNPVFAHNAKVIPRVPPHEAFRLLIQATSWPRYYENAADVRLTTADAAAVGVLTPEARFEFTTFGTRQRCRVREFEPGVALAWEARMPGNAAYHRWLFEPASEGGTKLITEECNIGLLAHLNPVMSRALHASHELWLGGFAAWAGQGERNGAHVTRDVSKPS